MIPTAHVFNPAKLTGEKQPAPSAILKHRMLVDIKMSMRQKAYLLTLGATVHRVQALAFVVKGGARR